jgi:two-component system LytT family response regulator
MIQTVIIDDDKVNRKLLSDLIYSNCPKVNIVGEAEGVVSGLKIIKLLKPDLVLLDISLPDGDAFDLLNNLENFDFKIIFISAHEKYAVKAIKFSAIDYVLKPIQTKDLVQAIHKVQHQIVNELKLQVSALSSNLNQPEPKSIILKTLENIYIVNIKDILRCEAERNYTMFFRLNKDRLIVSRPLKEYEELLTDHGFFRVHHSHLVNLAHIERFEKMDGGHIILREGSKIPVATRRREMLFDVFNKL